MAWILASAYTRVGFSVRHMMVATVHGTFTRVRADLRLDPGDLTQSWVRAEMDVASVDTHERERDEFLVSPDFFDAARFPAMVFESGRIESLPDGRYRVDGRLTIRDVTRSVPLALEHVGDSRDRKGRALQGFVLEGAIDRRDFGLTWNQVLEAGGVAVGERVYIRIDAEVVEDLALPA